MSAHFACVRKFLFSRRWSFIFWNLLTFGVGRSFLVILLGFSWHLIFLYKDRNWGACLKPTEKFVTSWVYRRNSCTNGIHWVWHYMDTAYKKTDDKVATWCRLTSFSYTHLHTFWDFTSSYVSTVNNEKLDYVFVSFKQQSPGSHAASKTRCVIRAYTACSVGFLETALVYLKNAFLCLNKRFGRNRLFMFLYVFLLRK